MDPRSGWVGWAVDPGSGWAGMDGGSRVRVGGDGRWIQGQGGRGWAVDPGSGWAGMGGGSRVRVEGEGGQACGWDSDPE